MRTEYISDFSISEKWGTKRIARLMLKHVLKVSVERMGSGSLKGRK